VPGFAFIIANTKVLDKTQENARSLVLDLYSQWKTLDATGQFRFTPPTHIIKACNVAIDEYLKEGGVKARFARYDAN